ncbi:hypothetical protein AAWM_09450 [Aspergillus awamori]|uniref:Uncharacterized protein n=1 Tax=Aspergillus awamori TaxID=105351 RepID=A0A401L4Z0_ASPAW|nr:hypothetical protein AAWM_09450 [Aspergillus awamori]GLA36976.1 hypothetical protein AnigIFM63309_003474 [Aspergillus niger]
MDVFYAYTYSTAGWLSLQSIALITVPEMMTTMLEQESRQPSSIETYLSRCLGMSLLTIAILTVMLTGSIPLTASITDPVTTDDSDPKAPYAVPTMQVTTIFHFISAGYAYAWFADKGQLAFGVGMVVSGALASLGIWCALFASSNGKISRKTGADKRTTGFPFKNKEAEKKHGKGLSHDHPPPPLSLIHNRNNKMVYIAKEAIIFFVILGCVVVSVFGYSIHYLMTNGFYGEERNLDFPPEQRIYMRQLRLRDLHWMARDHGIKIQSNTSPV